MEDDLYTIPLSTIDGVSTDLSQYRGKVMLIVNVASECGFTPQYTGLQELYDHFKEKGLIVLGFPCNQFGGQEPGTDEEIKACAVGKFHATFPLFAKIDVNGPNTHPLYAYLKTHGKGVFGTEGIKWNFTKFLVDRTGNVVGRFAPSTAPSALADEIEACISQKNG
jgi:glutathione peroxidase